MAGKLPADLPNLVDSKALWNCVLVVLTMSNATLMSKFKNCRNAVVTLGDSFVLILCENQCVRDGIDGLLILDSWISHIRSCDHERGHGVF